MREVKGDGKERTKPEDDLLTCGKRNSFEPRRSEQSAKFCLVSDRNGVHLRKRGIVRISLGIIGDGSRGSDLGLHPGGVAIAVNSRDLLNLIIALAGGTIGRREYHFFSFHPAKSLSTVLLASSFIAMQRYYTV